MIDNDEKSIKIKKSIEKKKQLICGSRDLLGSS
jgi:hypothetical protein